MIVIVKSPTHTHKVSNLSRISFPSHHQSQPILYNWSNGLWSWLIDSTCFYIISFHIFMLSNVKEKFSQTKLRFMIYNGNNNKGKMIFYSLHWLVSFEKINWPAPIKMHQYANLLLLNKETQEVQDSFANETQFVNIFTTNVFIKNTISANQ